MESVSVPDPSSKVFHTVHIPDGVGGVTTEEHCNKTLPMNLTDLWATITGVNVDGKKYKEPEPVYAEVQTLVGIDGWVGSRRLLSQARCKCLKMPKPLKCVCPLDTKMADMVKVYQGQLHGWYVCIVFHIFYAV